GSTHRMEPVETCGHSPWDGFCHDSAEAFWQYGSLGSHRERGLHVHPARRIAASVAASLLIAGGLSLSLIAQVSVAQAQGPLSRATAGSCEEAADVAGLPSPLAPWKGAPLRVIFAVEKPLQGELSLIAPNGSVAMKSRDRQGGPPYFWYAEVAAPAAGRWQVQLMANQAGCGTITREIAVSATKPAAPHQTAGSLWPVRDTWSRATENLYSAWIEKLFDAPLDASPSWKALHEVLRDKSRNVLFNHLGLGEDWMNMVVRPDCADLPYFLRAYFAFKMGLPYGYAKCTRGSGGDAPRCPVWWNIQNLEERAPPPETAISSPIPPELIRPGTVMAGGIAPPGPPATKPVGPPPRPAGLVPGFSYYLRYDVADGVHSGNGRTALNDEHTDLYPVPLTEDVLRPGTVYADPYGHLLILVRRVAQTEGDAGVYLAVDAQPDGTVARKRFWRGNFLFATDPGLGGPGFKHFRPIVRDKNGSLRRLTSAEIAKHPQYGDFSLDQGKLSVEDFYDRMDDVMSPEPLDPLSAMKEVITSLEEQVKARVTSVENGRKYQTSGKGDASMPDG